MKSNEFLSESEKQKGVDGKACWDGYKRMGTKKKGGKTVDNCVKMEESIDEYDDEAGMVDSNLETIKRAAEELDQVLGQDDNMAEWAQEKLAVVKSMLVAVKDYVVSQKSTGIDPQIDEELEETYHGDEFFEAYGEMWFNEDEQLDEAEYHGRKVPLGKPMQGDVKKFKVYVKDPSTGNIKKVNFGDPNMRIKKSNPARRKSFRARHNCANPGPRTKARYWSCRKW
jgi:hypothetical protein